MRETYEQPVVEVMEAEELIEAIGANAATRISGWDRPWSTPG